METFLARHASVVKGTLSGLTAGWFVNLCVQEDATVLGDEQFPGCGIVDCLTRRREDAEEIPDSSLRDFASSRDIESLLEQSEAGGEPA